MSSIAANIKQLRREKGLSQEQFAQSLHVTRQTVSAWERGMSQPGLATLQQMAQVLEVDPDRLLYGGAGGRHPAYRRVSFWPVLGVLPLFFVMAVYLIPLALGALFGNVDNTILLLSGQIFLAMVVVFCYCSLKDEIRNREFYQRQDDEEESAQLGETEQKTEQK